MNPRRYSQIERALHILDKSTTVDILKDDHYLLFLFKKTERIVSATYILTGLLPDDEPLKWELRDSALRLLKDIVSFKERALVHTKEFIGDTLSALAALLSLFDLAHIADLISPMNFSVMQKELEGLFNIIEGRGRPGGISVSPPLFAEDFFGISREIFGDAIPSQDGAPAQERKEAMIENIADFERLKRIQKEISQGHDMQENVLYNRAPRQRARAPKTENDTAGMPAPEALSSAVREERKRKVIAVLTEKSSAIIKDFSAVIQGCSEKTIQRLLSEMVETGTLKREGERRWSRYSLASGGGAV